MSISTPSLNIYCRSTKICTAFRSTWLTRAGTHSSSWIVYMTYVKTSLNAILFVLILSKLDNKIIKKAIKRQKNKVSEKLSSTTKKDTFRIGRTTEAYYECTNNTDYIWKQNDRNRKPYYTTEYDKKLKQKQNKRWTRKNIKHINF